VTRAIRFTVDTVAGALVSVGHGLAAGDPIYLCTTGELGTLDRGIWFAFPVDADAWRISRRRSGADLEPLTAAGTGFHTAFRHGEAPSVELYRCLVAALAGEPLGVEFGRRAVTNATNYGAGQVGRVVVVPGDETGKLGKVEPPPEVDGGLYGFPELVELHCFGRDPYDPRSELAQHAAAFEVWRTVLVALQEAHAGRLAWADARVVATPVEVTWGACLVQPVNVRGGRVLRRGPGLVSVPLSGFDSAAVFPSGDYYTPPLTP